MIPAAFHPYHVNYCPEEKRLTVYAQSPSVHFMVAWSDDSDLQNLDDAVIANIKQALEDEIAKVMEYHCSHPGCGRPMLDALRYGDERMYFCGLHYGFNWAKP